MYCLYSTYVSYSVSFYSGNNITALYMIFLHIPFLCNILTSVSVHVLLTYHMFCNILPLHHYMFSLHIAFLQHTYLYINTCSSYIHFCNILTSISVYVFPTYHLFSTYYLYVTTCFSYILDFCNILTSLTIHVSFTSHFFSTYVLLHQYMLFLHITVLQHTYLYIYTRFSYIFHCFLATCLITSISLHSFDDDYSYFYVQHFCCF